MVAWLRDRADWFSLATLQRLGSVLVSLAAVGALLIAYLALVYYQPDVRLDSEAASFIDLDALAREYGDEPVPEMVDAVARAYNDANTIELDTGTNDTLAALHSADLCKDIGADRVMQLYPETDCSDSPRIGRNKYYERLLLCRNEEALRSTRGLCPYDGAVDDLDQPLPFEEVAPLATDAAFSTALEAMGRAEFRRAKVIVSNVGRGTAKEVTISPSDGYAGLTEGATSPFTLDPTSGSDDLATLAVELDAGSDEDRMANDPDIPVVRTFETERGEVDGVYGLTRPSDRSGNSFRSFRASWEPSNRLASDVPLVILSGVAALVLLVFTIGDLAGHPGRRDADE